MKKLFQYIFLTSIRDKLFLSLFLMIFAIFVISNLVGYSAISEEAQMQLVYFSFLSRVIIVCGSLLFICFYINKEFEHKEIDFILSKSISRKQFILTYWLSFNIISIILIIPIILIILLFNHPNFLGLLWWSISIILELMLVSTFAIVTSLILKSVIVSIFSSFSFYFIGRMMGFFVYSIAIPKKFNKSFLNITSISEITLKYISSLFPRLDLFGKTEWFLYGIKEKQDIYIVLFQSIIYIFLMLYIAFYDFKRKEF